MTTRIPLCGHHDPHLVCDCGARWDALTGLPLAAEWGA